MVGAPENNILAQIKERSFKKASHLQKANQVLTDTIDLIDNLPTKEEQANFLKTEGLFRIAVDKKQSMIAYAKIMKNPTDPACSLHSSSNQVSNIANPTNTLNIPTQAFRDLPENGKFSPEVQKIFKDFINTTTDKSSDNERIKAFDKFIEDLIKDGAIEEAKFFHNLIHLATKVTEYEEFNKMSPRNIAIIFAPTMAAMIDPPLTDISNMMVLNTKMIEIFTAVIGNKPNFINNFDNAYNYPKIAEYYNATYIQDNKKFPLLKNRSAILGLNPPSSTELAKKPLNFIAFSNAVVREFLRQFIPDPILKIIDKAWQFVTSDIPKTIKSLGKFFVKSVGASDIGISSPDPNTFKKENWISGKFEKFEQTQNKGEIKDMRSDIPKVYTPTKDITQGEEHTKESKESKSLESQKESEEKSKHLSNK